MPARVGRRCGSDGQLVRIPTSIATGTCSAEGPHALGASLRASYRARLAFVDQVLPLPAAQVFNRCSAVCALGSLWLSVLLCALLRPRLHEDHAYFCGPTSALHD